MALPAIALNINLKFDTTEKEFSQLVTRMRQSVKVIGRRATQIAKRVAPGKRLRNQIDYVETETPYGLISEVFMPTGLKYTLPPGTVAHTIPGGKDVSKSDAARMQVEKGYPLRFYWERGPEGPGVYAYWAVSHPGYRPKHDWGQDVLDETQLIVDIEMQDLSEYIGNMWEDVKRVGT